MIPALLILISYLLGSLPFGFLLVKWRTGTDIRTQGSGNIGATNVLRTTGRGIAIATLVLDMLKGLAAVWLAARLSGENPLWMSAAAVAVMAGHAFPVFLRFRGGKAVASFIGAFAYLTPLPLFSVLIVFLGVVTATRYVSLGSIIAAGSFPFAVFLISHPPAPVLIAALLAGGFIVIRHRANLQRIIDGNEHVFTFRARKR